MAQDGCGVSLGDQQINREWVWGNNNVLGKYREPAVPHRKVWGNNNVLGKYWGPAVPHRKGVGQQQRFRYVLGASSSTQDGCGVTTMYWVSIGCQQNNRGRVWGNKILYKSVDRHNVGGGVTSSLSECRGSQCIHDNY